MVIFHEPSAMTQSNTQFQFISTLLVVSYDFFSMYMNVTQSNTQFQYISTPFRNPDDQFVHQPSDMTQSNTQFQSMGALLVVSYDFSSMLMNITKFNTQFQYIDTPFINPGDHFVLEPIGMTQSNTQF